MERFYFHAIAVYVVRGNALLCALSLTHGLDLCRKTNYVSKYNDHPNT